MQLVVRVDRTRACDLQREIDDLPCRAVRAGLGGRQRGEQIVRHVAASEGTRQVVELCRRVLQQQTRLRAAVLHRRGPRDGVHVETRGSVRACAVGRRVERPLPDAERDRGPQGQRHGRSRAVAPGRCPRASVSTTLSLATNTFSSCVASSRICRPAAVRSTKACTTFGPCGSVSFLAYTPSQCQAAAAGVSPAVPENRYPPSTGTAFTEPSVLAGCPLRS